VFIRTIGARRVCVSASKNESFSGHHGVHEDRYHDTWSNDRPAYTPVKASLDAQHELNIDA
jgi:hypothetical protein